MLVYKDFGEADSKETPLLIIHGLFGCGENWSSYARIFAQKRYVVTIDLPFHGSPGIDDNLEFHNLAKSVFETISSFKDIKKWIILGHSMGGKTTMAVALLYPQIIERIIVVDIAPKIYRPHHDVEFAALNSFNPKDLLSRGEADQILLDYVPDPLVRGFFLKNLRSQEEGGFEWRFDNLKVQENYKHVIDWPFKPNLASPIPLDVILGEKSHYVDLEDYELFSSFFARTKIHMVMNAGHWVQADNKTGFLEALEGLI